MTTATTPASASATIANLESAFAGESMAHIKYRYFAKIAREAGDEETARHFEATADQEVMHAFGHLDLLYPKSRLTPARALEIAIEGETYEFTTMYPTFRHLAVEEGNQAAVAEFDEQIAESREHAEAFRALLEKRRSDLRHSPRSKKSMPPLTSRCLIASGPPWFNCQGFTARV